MTKKRFTFPCIKMSTEESGVVMSYFNIVMTVELPDNVDLSSYTKEYLDDDAYNCATQAANEKMDEIQAADPFSNYMFKGGEDGTEPPTVEDIE
jgi:hypothetical protein